MLLALLVRLAELAFLLGIITAVGYRWPKCFDWVAVFWWKNPFRNSDWLKRLNPPWLMPVTYVLVLIVIGYETHGFAIAIVGVLLILSTFHSEKLDWLGRFNIGTMRWTRATGIVTVGFAFVWMTLWPWIDTLAVISIFAYLCWREREFLHTVLRLIRSRDSTPKSA